MLRQAQENLRLDRVVASPYPAPQLGIDLPLPSVSVGSPLSLFLDAWKFITREQSALNLLYHGINLSSYSKPLLNTNLLPFLLPEASRREHLSIEILYMWGKGTIQRVANTFCPGFYSLLFVTPSRSLTYGL